MIGASSASSNSAKPGFGGTEVTRITFLFMPGPCTSRLDFAFAQEPSTISILMGADQSHLEQLTNPFCASWKAEAFEID